MYHKNFGNEGKELWENLFVKHLDYIAQPSIEIKNKEILAFFVEYYIPLIRADSQLFSKVKNKVTTLLKECYEEDMN